LKSFRDKSTSTQVPRRRPPQWLFALLIPVCAIAPWLLASTAVEPVAAPTSDPSTVIRQAVRAQKAAGRPAKRLPSAEAVKVLAAELADPAGQGYDRPVSAKAAAAVQTKPGKYQTLGRIRIPRMKLDAFFGEGVYAAALDRGPGHWPGTPLPGAVGTSVLSGHRNTHTAPFRYLHLLKRGDKIIVTVGKGKAVTFHVLDTSIVPEAKYPAFVLKPAQDPASHNLTMFACHPAGNPVNRIVVRATTSKVSPLPHKPTKPTKPDKPDKPDKKGRR
jgi:sortase A